jgi:hypothetical protein
MFLGFVTGLVGFVWAPLGRMVGFFTWFILEYMMRVIEFFSHVPGASIEIGAWGSGVALLILLSAFIKMKKAPHV